VDRRSTALLVPVVPTKILCVGRNYRAHAAELGNEVPEKPLVFMKPLSSLLPHKGTVLLPPESSRVDYEGELTVVIGKRGRRLSREEAARAVFGLTCAIDVTARDLQKTDGQWWRAKGFDTFCPLGPAVETDIDPKDLLLETLVDGVVKQSGRTSLMAFDVPTLVAWASHAMTLEPGDVILTGTPEGVVNVNPGDEVVCEIEGLGRLVNTIVGDAWFGR
jgi:2-keto-4-pentenoate hydratase/2-oxohepta-3-ene-1,7-dioic acid hydratase in catechol pathway